MGTLFILMGIPCSGKSTYAKKFFCESNTIIISTDEIRKELTGTYKYSQKTNNAVFETAKSRVEYYLSRNFNVYFDATNTKKSSRKNFIDISKKHHSKVVCIVLNTPLEICKKRNSKRKIDRRIPIETLTTMSSSVESVSESEGFDKIVYINTD